MQESLTAFKKQVVVDSIITRYTRKGSGKTILLLHGWGDSSVGLGSIFDLLSSDYDVIDIDLPGFGETPPPSTPWGLEDYAVFLNHFLNKIEVPNVYATLGHSNGGAIAIKALSSGNIRCSKAILLASSGIRNTEQTRKLLLKILTKIGKVLTFLFPTNIKRKMRQKLYKSIGSDMLVVESMQETFKRVVSEDVTNDASIIEIPVLLVYGEDDQATPVAFGQELHKVIRNSVLKIIKGAGHFIHLDQPEQIQKEIKEFLK